ncbi:PilW family protein [Geopsychrobacter electrodiphilus]|uniref:PilW family protein n=1 Tax=Geopsychrobacter electrodiphilus TaxID=225196 RepID=UPI00038040E9|nr:PilW family protein [Geopsychrobacter electrodiphilus]
MMCLKKKKMGQGGMSLVELLVALTISLVLLAGVYQVFTGSTTSNRENEQFARLQENARFAMEILGREIRVAGYSGCSNTLPVNNLNPAGTGYIAQFLDFANGVQGNNWNGAGWTPAIDATVITNAVNGSDILTVRSLDRTDRIEITGSNINSANLAVVARNSINQGEIVIVSDCRGGDIFQVTNNNTSATLAHGVSTNPGNLSPNLSKGYNAGAEVFKFRSQIFYIRNNPAGVPSLYRLRWDGTTGAFGTMVAEELVQGVENMQVRYGIDTNGDRQVDSYVTAAGVANWTQVVAVRVGLLFQSDINGKTPVDTSSYDLDGDGVNEFNPPDERRMRRVFKTTIAIRNRVS